MREQQMIGKAHTVNVLGRLLVSKVFGDHRNI